MLNKFSASLTVTSDTPLTFASSIARCKSANSSVKSFFRRSASAFSRAMRSSSSLRAFSSASFLRRSSSSLRLRSASSTAAFNAFTASSTLLTAILISSTVAVGALITFSSSVFNSLALLSASSPLPPAALIAAFSAFSFSLPCCFAACMASCALRSSSCFLRSASSAAFFSCSSCAMDSILSSSSATLRK